MAKEPFITFNRCLQVHKKQAKWEYENVQLPPEPIWRATLSLPGVDGAYEGTAAAKKAAQELAIRQFLESPAGESIVAALPTAAGRSSAALRELRSQGPAAQVQTGEADDGGSGEVSGRLQKPLTVGRVSEDGETPKPIQLPASVGASWAVDRIYQTMLGEMRKGRAAEAVEIASQHIKDRPRILAVKHFTTLLSTASLRTPIGAALQFTAALQDLDAVAFPSNAARAYCMRHGRWAMAEYLAQGDILPRQSTPVGSLVWDGECAMNLLASRGKGTSEFVLRGKINWHWSRFMKGDMLFITSPPTAKPGLSPVDDKSAGTDESGGFRCCYEAELTGMQSGGFVVKLLTSAGETSAGEGLEGKLCRVDRAANRISFARQLDALKEMVAGAGVASGAAEDGSSGSWVREVLLAQDDEESGEGHEARLCEAWPVPKRSSPEEVDQVLQTVEHEANPSQEDALRQALRRRLTLIQGPPGTGKTFTSVLLIHFWLRLGRGPILATAESNVAVDNLVRMLASTGLDVLRIGRPEVSSPELEAYTLEGRCRQRTGRAGYENWGESQRLVREASVICATCSGAYGANLDSLAFGGALIDEAAQATEINTLLPLLRLKPTGTVALVGDHKQLPPTMFCRDIVSEGSTVPLFDRLVQRGVEPIMLQVQYRMHPSIADFSSSQYYDGRLASGVEASDRPAPEGFPWPASSAPVAFVQVQGSGERSHGTSYENASEAKLVLQVVKALLAGGLQPDDIGVITPYAAQVRLLKQRLPAKTECSSVDGFQGREKNVIVISTVRSNASGRVGFLSDARRLNVAVTRAKRGLIVCGDAGTLQRDSGGWARWLEWASSSSFVLDGLPSATAPAPDAAGLPRASADDVEALAQDAPPDVDPDEFARIVRLLSGDTGDASGAAAETPESPWASQATAAAALDAPKQRQPLILRRPVEAAAAQPSPAAAQKRPPIVLGGGGGGAAQPPAKKVVRLSWPQQA
eukprot:TRINITY_DN22406_c0_g1_i1.p1 TRINITY_DN22406_c0_g1~~TRINITY_DN22406_c0_g1_i1.p1  ORF type:complete len:989 (+),score=240.23 TRINITY_DN22406_c0_g1_i1:30-2969(+)